jgi:hypothetical protein
VRLSFGEELRRAQERGRERQRSRMLKHVAHARKFREKPKSTTFKCGHPRTPENSVSAGKHKRCKICHRAWCRNWHDPKNPRLPLYADARDQKTLLEECWR